MTKNLLKILWFSLLGFIVIDYFLLSKADTISGFAFYSSIIVFTLQVIIWMYLYIRLGNFKSRLKIFFRQLMEGNYEIGIKNGSNSKDEIAELEKLINKVGEQLRIYDELRAERVSFNYRAINLIYRTVRQGIIIANIEKKMFQLNPIVRSIFEVEQEDISFASIEKNEKNKEFVKLFKDSMEKSKGVREGNVIIKIPIRESEKEVYVKIIPLKDNKENVKMAIIFVNAAQQDMERGKKEPIDV